ncbi:dyslexia-associated protein KIAA0319-like protein homolog [Rhinatrema bivittatum]|uniref:dyslexia-associated protein KIAA0319-like protein homolog n=1 Tax=Rhinatrema bivittatum TaxID=194408 RepID=UPI00112A92A5|nr:dyslexia-associated protein KIAA0319-like protein homolog [Rhinatrema bivittatum]XP_029427873.1 dyslexia-associated protein KIAA0319-like protein homolog [Rhinatrema bivittatum]XP_029427874.1 dyslexia-associated protein KIAA0319-like protein homolog [Rhinatrema bivittatum]XP_029427875.1 dyslexia-associated protein KIAA0319-like protein homolog [Rhinatrema bivittatum]
METRLQATVSISSQTLGKPAAWTRRLHLCYLSAFLAALCSHAGAGSDLVACQPRKAQRGVGLKLWDDNDHLQLVGAPFPARSCLSACCRSPSCDAFWLLDGLCILAKCRTPALCTVTKMNFSDSFLVLLRRRQIAGAELLDQAGTRTHWQNQEKVSEIRARVRRTLRKGPWLEKPQLKKGTKRDTHSESPNEEAVQAEGPPGNPLQSPPDSKSPKPAGHGSVEQPRPGGAESSQEMGNRTLHRNTSAGDHDVTSTGKPLLLGPFSSAAALNLTTTGNPPNSGQTNDTATRPVPLLEPPNGVTSVPGSTQGIATLASVPTSVPVSSNTTTVRTTSAALSSTTVPTPAVKELVVSAGDSVQVTLPKNAVQLNAFVVPGPPPGTSYTYDWRLITHPKDYSGEMEGKHSQILKLSKLTLGLYEFKVLVDGENAHGEGYVNVTVNPEPRVNQPPVAIVSPRYQEISLPTTSTVIDGSQSTDDDKIVSYRWEELKGPLREEKVSADTAILTLTNLVPGSYMFSLTVVDSDGASNSTTANLTVSKAVDYPPVANAGANQVITLPQNSIVLYGNQSTDDHGIVSYEWSQSPNSKGKVVEMQGVRTSMLQLSAMQEGDYMFQLTVTDSAGHQATAEVTVIVQPENNKAPKADAGPDKELTLPVDSTTLDGSRSSDDQRISSYLWEKTRGPDGVRIENSTSSVATVTGLQSGSYEFTLTVKDERNLQSQSSVTVIVKEEINKAPVASIAGNVVITLPTNMAELDGSRSSDDKGIISYAWSRDEGSPAAGEVLNGSDHHAVLLLSNLVEGMYTFHLKVTDAKGESDVDRATVEVKPDPKKKDLVEMVLDVNVSMLTEKQKELFLRQIGVLLGVLDSDIMVQKIQPYTEQSTKMVFYVQNQPPHQNLKGYQVAWTLKNELHRQQKDFLVFRALEINTVTCQLNCSDHGRCNSFTKRCVCDPFWMENLIRVQLGDGEHNCEWSVLYVVIASFVILVALGILSWMLACCCRRRKGKSKRKSKYKILDATDDLESLELKANHKSGGRVKAQVLNTSLMHSESELDSDDAIFTWTDREKGKLLRSQNGSVRNGQLPPKSQREEIL